MPKYASLVKVRKDFQNVQELTSIWGDIRTELETNAADLEDTYAILGEYDFLIVLDAEDRDDVYKASMAIERHGLDLQTMEIVPTDEFATLVDDL